MATDRLHRLLKLIAILQSGKAHPSERLQDELGISRRTLFRDLSRLQAAGIPCQHVSGEGYLIRENFLFPALSISPSETLSLMFLVKLCERSVASAMIPPAKAAIERLLAQVPHQRRESCEQLLRHVTVWPRHLNDNAAEPRIVAELLRCLDERRACRVAIRNGDHRSTQEILLEPLAIHLATHKWYVTGCAPERNQLCAQSVESIQRIQATEHRFERPPDFDIEDHISEDGTPLLPMLHEE